MEHIFSYLITNSHCKQSKYLRLIIVIGLITAEFIMAKLKHGSLTFKHIELDFGNIHINCQLQNQTVCSARYKITKNNLQLNWIETQEKYQRQGIATKVMNLICDEALKQNMQLVINVVNHEVLEFYYQWFLKRETPSGSETPGIREKFDKLWVTDADTDLIILTFSPDDLVLKTVNPGESDNNASTSFTP
jgi:GNAT superfamily N-acetyltransferase